jgi:hypothetical protein
VRLKGAVDNKTRLTTTFNSVPDVPLSKLTLNLTGGPKGALMTTVDLCDKTPTFDATYTSQSGVTKSDKVPAEMIGCGGAAGSSSGLKITGRLSGLKRKRPALQIRVTSAAPLKELRLGLPTSLRPASARALRKSGRLLLAGRRTKGTSIRATGGRLILKTPKGKTAKTLSVTLPAGVLRLKKPIRVGQKVNFTITGVGAGGKTYASQVTLKAVK